MRFHGANEQFKFRLAEAQEVIGTVQRLEACADRRGDLTATREALDRIIPPLQDERRGDNAWERCLHRRRPALLGVGQERFAAGVLYKLRAQPFENPGLALGL